MFTQNAMFAMIHCIIPILLMFLVWVFNSPCTSAKNLRKQEKARLDAMLRLPRLIRIWIRIQSNFRILLKLCQKIPFPPITRIVKFILETQKCTVRSREMFEKKMPKREEEIYKNEDIVNLSSSIEAATEASPQFFFQTVYFLPVLIINIAQFQNWEELVSYKMLSIVFSFISVAVSNHFIR